MEDFLPFIWLGIFVISVIVEFCTADLVSIWFIAGSIVSLVLSCIPGIPYWIEIIVFVVVSAILLIFFRKILRKLFKVKDTKTNTDSLVGYKTKVIKELNDNQLGEIKINGVVWSICSNEKVLHVGDNVCVTSIEGNKLIVKKED